MSAPHPEEPPESTGTPGSDPEPSPAVVAALLARDHAASLASVARERVYLLEALRRGEDIDDLARRFNVTPRAIRHLLGTTDGP